MGYSIGKAKIELKIIKNVKQKKITPFIYFMSSFFDKTLKK